MMFFTTSLLVDEGKKTTPEGGVEL